MQAIRLVNTSAMSRNDWLEHRRHGIGGSDAAVIMGVSPWTSLMDLWLEKTGQYVEGIDSESMYWGRVLEDVIAKEFAIRNKLKIRRVNAILQHPDYPYMIANVDRVIVGRKEGLEIKTGHEFSSQHWENGVPAYYYAQVQHYMAVTGFKLWHIAVLIGGNKYEQFVVHRSEDYINELIAAEAEFWKLVEERTPPPIDGTKASTELVKKLYPEAEKGKEIDLPFEAFELIQQYERACEEEKRIQLIKDEAVNKLKDMLGTAERGSIHGRTVIWQNVVSKRLDTKALQKEYPDIYERFAQESIYRRFSIK